MNVQFLHIPSRSTILELHDLSDVSTSRGHDVIVIGAWVSNEEEGLKCPHFPFMETIGKVANL